MKKRANILVGAFCLLSLAIATFMEAQLAPPCCNLGDVDGNGTVNTLDILEIQEHMYGVPTDPMSCLELGPLCNGDIDADGRVTLGDIDLIQDYVLGIITTFPRCGDLDEDGVLEWSGSSAQDSTCLFKIITEDPPPSHCNIRAADANDDGVLDALDGQIFFGHANGNLKVFRNCECPRGSIIDPVIECLLSGESCKDEDDCCSRDCLFSIDPEEPGVCA